IFGLATDKLYCLKLDIDNRDKKVFEIPFEETTRELRNFFLTDTSLIILLRNKEKNLNTYKLEYCFNIDKEVVTKLHINAFSENETLSSNIINNKMLFFQKNKESIIFTTVDEQTKTKTTEFNIKKLMETSHLKRGDFKELFLNKQTTLSYTGDKNIMSLYNDKKCYINNDTAYLIAHTFGDDDIEMWFFDLQHKTYSYKAIDLKAMRNYDKKKRYHYNYCMINNTLAVTRYSTKDVFINFYNATTGSLLKEYTIDSLSSYTLQNHYAMSTMLNKEKSTPINDINKDIIRKVSTWRTFVSCIPISQDNFMLASGTFRGKQQSVLGLVAFIGLTAISLNNPLFTTVSNNGIFTTITKTYYIPTQLLEPFNNNKNYIESIQYFATSFNTHTLQETTNYKTAFLTAEKKVKKEDLLTIPFLYNNQLYDMKHIKLSMDDKKIVLVKHD
ncbi:MAG: hypothetical protein ACOVO1_13000, partial [Chitinophagaceae bacterium]